LSPEEKEVRRGGELPASQRAVYSSWRKRKRQTTDEKKRILTGGAYGRIGQKKGGERESHFIDCFSTVTKRRRFGGKKKRKNQNRLQGAAETSMGSNAVEIWKGNSIVTGGGQVRKNSRTSRTKPQKKGESRDKNLCKNNVKTSKRQAKRTRRGTKGSVGGERRTDQKVGFRKKRGRKTPGVQFRG